MKAEPKEEPPLPRQRAFVIQFRTEADIKRGPFSGRAEHVVSGQAIHFHSLEELLAFLARVLAEGKTDLAQ